MTALPSALRRRGQFVRLLGESNDVGESAVRRAPSILGRKIPSIHVSVDQRLNMPIAREGQFLVTTKWNKPHLGLESSMIDACIQEAINKPYAGVFGSPTFGFREKTLDSLRSIPQLEEIWFWDVELDDVEAVYTLKRLRSFGVQPGRPPIDFSQIPTLERLVVTYRAGDSGVDRLKNLHRLSLWHYSPKKRLFGEILLPDGLTELEINWANPKALDGLTPLLSLRRLEIHRCRNLESLSVLPRLFPNLEHLVVAACGKVSVDEGRRAVENLPKLKHAHVQKTKLV